MFRKNVPKIIFLLLIIIFSVSLFTIGCREDSGAKKISVKEFYEIWLNDESSIILDVGTQKEYDKGHIEGAILIPLDELKGRLDELPQDKPIIVYCRSGDESAQAADILVNNGLTEVYDAGGVLNCFTASSCESFYYLEIHIFFKQ